QHQEVPGAVAERVRGIVATTNDSPVATPVGVEAAPHEIVRMPLHDLSLPRFEGDPPQVPRAPPMLWKQAWPLIRIRVDDDDGWPTPEPHTVAGQQFPHGIRRLTNHAGVLRVHVDLQPERARGSADCTRLPDTRRAGSCRAEAVRWRSSDRQRLFW